MSFLPPIAPNNGISMQPRTAGGATAAAAAANRRVSFNVPQLTTPGGGRPSDSVGESSTFAYSDNGDTFLGSGSSNPVSTLEGRDFAQTGAHNGRFSLTSRSRLNSVGSTFHVADGGNNVHIARRIWGGKVDNISHSEMLQRVRGQFKKQYTREHLPLVLPAQIPSSERAAVPQLPKFSRGIRQYKRVHGTLGFDERDTHGSADDEDDVHRRYSTAEMDGEEAARAASAPATLRGEAVAAPVPADHTARIAAALTAEPITRLSARQLETVAARAALRAVAEESTPSSHTTTGAQPGPALAGLSTPLGWADAAARRRASTASARRASLLQADAPLGALATDEERWQRLREIEQLERLHIMSTERWDHQVVVEMMVAHYVSFVLKPEMEELQARERVIRGFISYEEEHDRYDLFNAHPLAKTLLTELRALEAKKLKLTRIEQLQRAASATSGEDGGSPFCADAQPTPTSGSAPSHQLVVSDTAPAPTAPAPTAAARTSVTSAATTRTSLATYSAPPSPHGSGSDHGGVRAASTTDSTAPATAETASLTGSSTNTDDARLILQRYARRKHARELKEAHGEIAEASAEVADAMDTTSQDDAPLGGFVSSGARRRTSELVVPLESVAARAPRRNTVGIADYIALLDEDGLQRSIIVQSERAERHQIYALLQDELAVVMDWQRKRMHLERLLYWRNLREEQLRKEVEELTDLSDPRAIDPKTAVLLATVEDGEEEDRATVEKDETNARSDMLYWGDVLHVSATAGDLVERYRTTQAACWRTTCAGYEAALQELEAATRATLAREEDALWTRTALPQVTDLRALYEVSIDPRQYAAVLTLQRYFRASLKGRLGRHTTNMAVGRDVQSVRDARKIERGLGELKTFQQQLLDEEAAIVAEIEAEHAAQRSVLFAAEQRNRISLSTEEEWSLAVVRKTGERGAAEAFVAWHRRVLKEEHMQRVEVDVMEEMQRERLVRSMVDAASVVVAGDALMAEAQDLETRLRDEESAAWHALLSSEYDMCELLRIDMEEKANASEPSHQMDADEL